MAHTWSPEIEEIDRRAARAALMGGAEKVARQRAAGRSTVRDRIAELLDDGSFEEIGALAGFPSADEHGEVDVMPANFLFGLGDIDGRRVAVGADDFTIRGGAADASIMAKQVDSERLAGAMRVPLVRLIEGTGGGGSVKMIESAGYTYVPANPGWDHVVANMSLVPVVAACMGPVAGLGAARAVMSHLSILIEGQSQLFVAGPPVVRHATGADLDKEQLGGAGVHARSGAIDRVVPDEAAAMAAIRQFLGYLPSSVHELPPVGAGCPPAGDAEVLADLVPRNRRQPYKLKPLLDAVFDEGSVFSTAGYGASVYTGLARLDGHPVGVVATDPYKGATMTPNGADALTRLIDLCETFHLPLVSLTDQAGMMIGLDAEKAASIRRGARAVAAAYQARIPMAEVIVRRVFGVGGAGQINRHRYSRQWAWPSGDWGSLPVEGGIEAAYRRDLEASDDPDRLLKEIQDRLEDARSPFHTAERYGVQDVIDPRRTRDLLVRWVRDAYRVLPELVGPPSLGVRP
ncbi:methylmalonyl-CoA carboxyltransferase [Nocardioides albidus]|uniref:Methylmalonyl-CoA carboxyltransferase n=1 Tax=Nocardioides albidus TaxID=1517589 RepID=A0A5C4VM56_9ACTN|nr:carboxyl transferase domain-containing protein [Nocardioides albidus]TNM36359.1 methylmalonyl-CoA carboxyltransferase [Nocardioides albidus]